MTSFYGFDGVRAMIGERLQRLRAEADRERVARQARGEAAPERPQEAAGQPEPEWGPWLQGGEPLHLSRAGAGLS